MPGRSKPSTPPPRPQRVPCPHCGYDLAGLDVHRCPECGEIVALGFDLAELAKRRAEVRPCATCGSKAPPSTNGQCPACGARRQAT